MVGISTLVGTPTNILIGSYGKISFNDSQRVLPRDVPLMIWSDPVHLPWSAAERQELAADEETCWLLDDIEEQEPVWPPVFDKFYPEIVIRGLTRMVPGLSTYLGRMGRPWVDGGYYCKTQENRPLICPLDVEGAFLIGALSGFGVMAGMAAGELLAAHVAGATLPDYAPAFDLKRYEDPAYQAMLAEWDPTTGQL